MDKSYLSGCETVGDAVCLHPWVASLPAEVLAPERSRRPRGSSRGLTPAAHRGLLMWIYYAMRERPRTLGELADMTGFSTRQVWGLMLRCIMDGRILRDGDFLSVTRPLLDE